MICEVKSDSIETISPKMHTQQNWHRHNIHKIAYAMEIKTIYNTVRSIQNEIHHKISPILCFLGEDYIGGNGGTQQIDLREVCWCIEAAAVPNTNSDSFQTGNYS